jgi:hypothetical protein
MNGEEKKEKGIGLYDKGKALNKKNRPANAERL